MPRRLLVCALVAGTAACPAVDRFALGSAHLRLDRAGPPSGMLLEVPVEASYCAADTTVTLVGADRSHSVALALKTPWPAPSLAFTVDSTLGATGTAALAVRPVGDSIGPAMTGLRGSVTLEAGSRLAGRVDIVMTARDTLRLIGEFAARDMAIGGCPRP